MRSQSVDYGPVRQVLNGTEHSAKTRGLYNASDSGSERTGQQLHNALSVALYRPLSHEIYLDLCRTKRYSNLSFLHTPPPSVYSHLRDGDVCACALARRRIRVWNRRIKREWVNSGRWRGVVRLQSQDFGRPRVSF